MCWPMAASHLHSYRTSMLTSNEYSVLLSLGTVHALVDATLAHGLSSVLMLLPSAARHTAQPPQEHLHSRQPGTCRCCCYSYRTLGFRRTALSLLHCDRCLHLLRRERNLLQATADVKLPPIDLL